MKKLINIIITIAVIALPQYTFAQTKSAKTTKKTETLDRSVRPQAAPAPLINIGKSENFELANGLKVFVVENHKIPRVSYSLSFDYNQVPEGNLAGMADFAGEILRTGTTSMNKDELDEAVDFIGAYLSTSSTGIYASALKKHNEELLTLMADVLMNPAFEQEELDKMKVQALSALKAAQNEAGTISDRISKQLIYGASHPYGESMTEKSIENITIDHCRAFYNAFFKPNIGYLAIVGDITKAEAMELIQKYFGKWEKADVLQYTPETPSIPAQNSVAIVDRPDAVQTALRIGYAIDLKPGSKDAIKARVMNTILGGGSFRLFNNLREDKAYTYGAYSQLNPNKLSGIFMVNTEVRNPVTDSAVNEVLFEMQRIRNEAVTEDELSLVKNYLNGNFALSLERPQTIANFAINTAKYGLSEDYYANYMKELAAVTAEDVQSVARKYIKPENTYIIAVGKAAEIAPKLERFAGNSGIKYYDFNGKEYDPATKVKPAPEGITAKTVIDNYINAIGGEKALNKVKDITIMASTNIQGMTIGFEIYRKAPNLYMTKMGAGDMVFQKVIFDGTSAWMISPMAGENQEIGGSAFEDLKIESELNSELHYDRLGVALKLEGIEEIDDQENYKLVLTYPSGSTATHYYDVKTGFRTREISDNGIATFADYREVNGMKFPYMLSQQLGPQTIDLKVLSVKVNTKLKDDVFKVN